MSKFLVCDTKQTTNEQLRRKKNGFYHFFIEQIVHFAAGAASPESPQSSQLFLGSLGAALALFPSPVALKSSLWQGFFSDRGGNNFQKFSLGYLSREDSEGFGLVVLECHLIYFTLRVPRE